MDLITIILLRKGTDFSIKHFYMRRILRLLPALYVFMIASSIIYFIWFSKFNLNEIIAGLFYYYNYFYTQKDTKKHVVEWLKSNKEFTAEEVRAAMAVR
mgnify:CR=1 FL=1